ncbi:MAG: DNA translocase FtsK, partial [Clostridia bacterium]|nr:DNA translocase FtsK [Clostridia bacterium]
MESDEVAKPKSRKEYLLTPPELDLTNYFNHNKKEIKQNIDILKSNDEPKVVVSNVEPKQKPNKVFHEEDILASPINRSSEKSYIAPVVENTAVNDNPKPQPVIEEKPEKVADKILKSLMQEEETSTPTNISFDVKPISFENDRRNIRQIKMENDLKPIQYKKPSLDLITTPSVDLSTLNEDVATKSSQLEETLEQFNIPAKVIGASIGPAVTRYELEMPPGVSVKKILGHSEDIAYVLASNGDIRIEAPIPGMSAVGVEVPNNKIATVSLKEVLSSPEFLQNKNPLLVALGKDISGKIITCNLEKMPHLLVAGSTNSGKSVCLNTVIISLLYRLSPDEVKLVLIDPKRVEFSLFNGIPHLLTPHVINDSSKAVNALNYAVDEMERRYLTFETTKTRNIQEYNQLPDIVNKSKPKMSYIVVIIDELADLMMVTKKEVEEKIARLAQKARAAGIHLILATQRPSVDVITGTIKNNFPSRISFSLMSFADSKTVLDMGGAEKLLGKGDMLYKPSDVSEPKRVQGCFVSTKEIDDIVTYVKDNNKDYVFDKDIEDFIMGNNNHVSAQGGIEGQRSGL